MCVFVHNHVQECVGVCMHAHIRFECCVLLFLSFSLPLPPLLPFLSSSSLLKQVFYDALGILEHTVNRVDLKLARSFLLLLPKC